MYSESSLSLWAILGEDCTPAVRNRWSRRLRKCASRGTRKSPGWRTPIGKRAGARAARRPKTGCARNANFARETAVDQPGISPLWAPGDRLDCRVFRARGALSGASAGEAGRIDGCAAAVWSGARRADGGDRRGFRAADRAGLDAVEPSGLPGVLRELVDAGRDSGRAVHSGAERQRDVVEDVAGGDGAGAGDAAVAAAVERAAGRLVRVDLRHGLHFQHARYRGGAGSGRPGIAHQGNGAGAGGVHVGAIALFD